MKVNVSKEQILKVLDNKDEAKNAKVEISDPWWVIVLKVTAYLIGLILAGAATTTTASAMGLI